MIARCVVAAGVAVVVLWASVAGVKAGAATTAANREGDGVWCRHCCPEPEAGPHANESRRHCSGQVDEGGPGELERPSQAILGQLAKLGAVKESVVFAARRSTPPCCRVRQQMAMMIMARMGNRSKKNAKKRRLPWSSRLA